MTPLPCVALSILGCKGLNRQEIERRRKCHLKNTKLSWHHIFQLFRYGWCQFRWHGQFGEKKNCAIFFLCHIMAFWGHCAKFAFYLGAFWYWNVLLISCDVKNALMYHISLLLGCLDIDDQCRNLSRDHLEIFNRSILIHIWKFHFWLVRNRN